MPEQPSPPPSSRPCAWTAALLLLALAAALSAGPGAARESAPPPEEVVQRMLAAQSGLLDFTAEVTLRARVAGLPLFPISGRLYSKRPSQVKIQVGGASFLPRHPFLFPDPLEFTTGKYTLALAGREELEGDAAWIVDVTPVDPGDTLRMRFWISSRSWLIVQSDMSVPGAGRTVMRARYVRGAERAWVPSELSGRGGLLLLDLLPAAGLGKLLTGLNLSEKITFRAVLSGHQVNTGLSDSFFAR